MKHLKEEIAYVMIKPDGVQKGLIGEIIKRFEQRHLKVVALEMHHATKEEINNHYPKDEAWITRLGEKTLATFNKYGIDPTPEYGSDDPSKIGPLVRAWLIDYMTMAPIVKIAVQGVHAVDMVRKICGSTMPYLADMGTIRGDFSNDSPAIANLEKRSVMNLVHASETPQEAEHEIKYWFEGKKVFDYKRFGVDN